MSRMLIKAVVATLIQVVLIFNQRSVEAEFSDTCDNSTNSLTCIRTYDQLYNSLTKSDNSFNIESALYPAKRPSSVRVFVNVHGPNKTDGNVARYTWSLSCLYVAVPTIFLEIASLGSILVSHRTKKLDLNIPNFCCNVSKTEDERRKTIKEMIEDVLAALQDLAILPGRRDPRLNNAECLIEGHGIDMEATGHSFYIRIMIWGSFFFTCAAYEPFCQMTRGYVTFLKLKNSSEYKAMICLGILVGILGSVIWIVLSALITYYIVRDGPLFYVDIFLLLTPVLCFITPLTGAGKYIWGICRGSISGSRNNSYNWFIAIFAPLSVIYTSFCFCWVLIGIMLNPIWGLTVALAICFTFASFIYVVYNYVDIRQSSSYVNMQGYLRRMWVCSWLAVLFLTLVVIFAGQAFNGKETADEILKTALLAALAYVTSWLSCKRFSNNSPKSGVRQTQPALGGSYTDHFPSQSPPADDAVNQLLQLVTDYSGEQPPSSTLSTYNTADQMPPAVNPVTEIIADVHQPPSRNPSNNHTHSQPHPAVDLVTEAVSLHQPVSGEPSNDDTWSQAHSASDPGMLVIDQTTAEIQSSSEGSSYRGQPSALSETLMEIVVDGVHQSPSSETSQHTSSQLQLGDQLSMNNRGTVESRCPFRDAPNHQTQPNDSSMKNKKTVELRKFQPPIMIRETSV